MPMKTVCRYKLPFANIDILFRMNVFLGFIIKYYWIF